MAKFKKGDKVRILDGSMIGNYTGGWVDDMNEYVGKVATIECADHNFLGGNVGYYLPEFGYTFDERGLELVNETIVIYRDDQKVIALDKSTGKTATARCNPADTFNFMTGAKLAFDRLTDEGNSFKVGDIVRGKAGSGEMYAITHEDMTKAEVIAVSKDGKRIDVKIKDHKCGPYIGNKFYNLASKYFELVDEAKPQVKEVKRYAKPGEYIKIVKPHGCSIEDYKKGDILKVVTYSGERPTPDATYYKDEIWKYANADEYVVLEGYEPEQPGEPTYYNGKIIFTKGDDVFKTGHVYEIKDGTVMHPHWGVRLPANGSPLKDIEDVKDYFTGSMTGNRKRKPGWSPDTLELIEVEND